MIITFDDGSHDWVKTVLPMLQARGMVAEFYLTLDAIKHGNLTWKEVRRLAAAGNGIGAHDVHHVQLAGLGTRPRQGLGGHDVVRGQRGRAGSSASTSASSRIRWRMSGAASTPTLETLVRTAGYTSARGIQRGIVQRPTTRFRMRVVRIGVHDDVANLRPGAPWSRTSRRSRRGCAASPTRRRLSRGRSGRPGDVAGDYHRDRWIRPA